MNQFRLSGFADEAGKTAEEQMDVLEKNGIRQIELRTIDGKKVLDLTETELREIYEKLSSRGFSVSAIGSPVGKSPIEEDFAIAKTSFIKALKAAEILKAPYIRAFSFFIPKDSDPTPWAGEVVSRLSELVKMAEQKGVIYALENESGIFTDIPDRCVYVLEKVPLLRMAFDPGNFIMNNAEPLEAWPRLKNKVAYFHIKDGTKEPKRFVPAGEGEGSISAILKDAYNSGFDSVLSIEPHLGYLADLNNAQHFTKAANALKKVLNQTFGAALPEADISALA
jgi:sugar phosphate isomerase/epimerase